ncbi:hypothetical protein DRW03_02415 [Corallococcus sp. H22C18031201]|nr:hypothetical protein DRW03_02415 [Corallococcus sp. H22C18031201]
MWLSPGGAGAGFGVSGVASVFETTSIQSGEDLGGAGEGGCAGVTFQRSARSRAWMASETRMARARRWRRRMG